jgi:hypothetical protein
MSTMDDHLTKRSAQEYLANKLSEEVQQNEDRLNREAAAALALTVWKRVTDTVFSKIQEWNRITNEQSLTCKETALGDLRIWCAGRNHQMTVHFDSYRRQVIIRNTARPEHEKDTVLVIEGYLTETGGRDAHLTNNEQPVNLDMVIVGHLRVLAGLTREVK